MNLSNKRFDPILWKLLPHRPPMLLINKVVSVEKKSSKSRVLIDEEASFFKTEKGVPATIGLEYMGQTAALIAGYEVLHGDASEPHLGFLLGTRQYESSVAYFKPNTILEVECTEGSTVGDTLASFICTIRYQDSEEILAGASLSVLRKPAG